MIGREAFEDLYREFNRREFVSPDPLQFLYDYQDPFDREIVGLIASSLAYGRVAQILKSVSRVLERMPGPYGFIMNTGRKGLRDALAGFKHRFTTGDDVAEMLYGIKTAIERHGTLQECFMSGFKSNDTTILPALERFVQELTRPVRSGGSYLLPCPSKGSACKRMNLFLRWMVRNDEVDPGGWRKVPRSALVIPLDTHMDNICRKLGITSRKQANMKTALEITEFFRGICPEDPVKYDFALTRLGILSHTDLPGFIAKWGKKERA